MDDETRATLLAIRDDQREARDAAIAMSKAVGELAVHMAQISTTLVGIPDTPNGGLVARVISLECKHDKLAKVFWIVLGLLVGSGVLGTSIYALIV